MQGFYIFSDGCVPEVAALKVCGGQAQGVQRLDDLSARTSQIVSFGEDSSPDLRASPDSGELYVVSLGGTVLRVGPAP